MFVSVARQSVQRSRAVLASLPRPQPVLAVLPSVHLTLARPSLILLPTAHNYPRITNTSIHAPFSLLHPYPHPRSGTSPLTHSAPAIHRPSSLRPAWPYAHPYKRCPQTVRSSQSSRPQSVPILIVRNRTRRAAPTDPSPILTHPVPSTNRPRPALPSRAHHPYRRCLKTVRSSHNTRVHRPRS